MNLKKSLVPLISDLTKGTNIRSILSLLEKMQSYSQQEIKDWRDEKFVNLINHFYNNSSYYHKKVYDHGIHPQNISSIDDIRLLPIISKQELIKNRQEVIPKNINSIKYNTTATGGSTGDPLKFLLDKESLSFNTAFNIISWEKHGYRYGDKHLVFGSSSLNVKKNVPISNIVYDYLRGRIPVGGTDLSNVFIKSHLDLISSKRIKHLYGYASSIFLIALFYKDNNILPPANIKTCFTTAEILSDHYRQTIEEYLGCKVVDCYGARDGGVTAYETSYKNYEVSYHSYIEVDSETESGEILCTDLFNYAFPFVRYR
ncbi:MAG: phenylacetate--CoA ligase family protein, partial [Candidatus Peribacteraceae bacterium]|nr:phenylacetate--CoA ligase family protein [Candidatus Peribacteraceae bacterium]